MDQADIAVIGGGLIGCATAYYLARGGARVTLLERGELNREASGQNAGSLHFQLEFRMIEQGERTAEQFALSIPLCLDARSVWRRLEAELATPIGAHLAGGLMVAETADELESLRRKSMLENRDGLDTRVLDADEVRTIAPYLSRAVCGACWCPSEGHANPRLVAPAFARAAESAGTTIRVRTPVVGLNRKHASWQVETASGAPLEAQALVVAAGIWSGEVTALAGAPLPLVPHPLTIFATAVTKPLVTHLIQHAGQRLSLKQTAEGNLLVGGGWPSRLAERDGHRELSSRPTVRFDSVAGSASIATRIVPALAALAAIRIWTGIAAATDDNVPILGELPGRPGLYVATAGSGFTLGPTFARLIAEQILDGRSSLPISAYSPARFGRVAARW
jgi:sarcosine oxidase subunit beta